MESADIIIIGGGLIGLATAYQFQQTHPYKRIVILEKESAVATHQSGRNSGVLHSGIYYPPQSLKAHHCREGKGLMEQFCQTEKLPIKKCGKVIVAINQQELPYLHTLYQRGIANGVDCHVINAGRLNEIEPYATGLLAIHVPSVSVVDFQKVAQRLALKIETAGGSIYTSTPVHSLRELNDAVVVQTAYHNWVAPVVINAAGLYADRIAQSSGIDVPIKIVPFRGEYYRIKPERDYLVRGLIYPVPDPTLPFLGVHFTRTLYGEIDCGPNAVLAPAREGYDKWSADWRDTLDYMTSRRVRRLPRANLTTAWWEWRRSWDKSLFATTLQRLVPSLTEEDLLPAPAGVRAQAVTPSGELLQDFLFHETKRVIHVLSAPSPGATSSLSIGRTLAESAEQRLPKTG